ncbi:MAG: cation:proton antiporter [Leptospirillia bacterium]
MSLINIAAVLIVLSAVLGYVNHRFIRLPSTIGLMVVTLASSMLVLAVAQLFPGLHLMEAVAGFVGEVDFNRTVMEGMLSILLFAGALHVELDTLLSRRWTILSLATVGVVISTFAVGGLMYLGLGLLGLNVAFIHCLIFGALISPTDPIAVLGILKSAGASQGLTAKITGESLFNDGVGVVLFTAVVAIAFGGTRHSDISGMDIGLLFFEEVAGGVALGLALGYGTYRLIKNVDDHALVVLLTVALVLGGSALAASLHFSAPLCAVVAGLFIGNHGKRFGMTDEAADHVDTFWTLNDEILNAVLFLLIGLEILAVRFEMSFFLAGMLAIPICLVARLVSVAIPISLLGLTKSYTPGAIPILTWSGLKGGISVALALSIPSFPQKPLLVACTYLVVLFSIIVQGLTVGKVIQRLKREEAEG